MKRVLLIASLFVISSNVFAASQACVAARKDARRSYLRTIEELDRQIAAKQISKTDGQAYKESAVHILNQAEALCTWDADITH